MRGGTVYRRALTAAALLTAALAGPTAARADWSPVQAGQLNTAGSSAVGVAAASMQGVPYVAWSETEADKETEEVLVARLNGSSFSQVGGAVKCLTFARPSIAEVAGKPYLACEGGSEALSVFSFNGSSWEAVGAPIKVATNSAASIGEVEHVPYVAYVEGGAEPKVRVARFSGSWTPIASLPQQHGDKPESVSLLSDGSQPILAWSEVESSGTTHSSVFADRLSGGSWLEINGAQALSANPTLGWAPALALIGSTPYLALQDEGGELAAATEYVFALSGTEFQQVGGTAASRPAGLVPAALGTFEGEPLLVTPDELPSTEVQLTAESFGGGAWTQLGGALGVPPLPRESGTPYAGQALAAGPEGIPYVALLQQQPGNDSGAENVYVEAHTTAGVDPNKRFEGTYEPPQVRSEQFTSTPSLSSTAGARSTRASTRAFAPAASLDLARPPAFIRHGHSIKASSGVLASCPRTSGASACDGDVGLKVIVGARSSAHAGARGARPRRIALSLAFSIPSGGEQVVAVALSKAILKRLGAPGELRGTVSVTISGPNARSASISQALAARLP